MASRVHIPASRCNGVLHVGMTAGPVQRIRLHKHGQDSAFPRKTKRCGSLTLSGSTTSGGIEARTGEYRRPRLHGAPRLACIMLPARPERARPEFPARPANCASDGTNRHVRPAGEWLRAFGHRFPMRADCFGPPDDLERSLFGLERSPGPLPLPWLHSGAAMQRARWQEAVREGAGTGRTCD